MQTSGINLIKLEINFNYIFEANKIANTILSANKFDILKTWHYATFDCHKGRRCYLKTLNIVTLINTP